MAKAKAPRATPTTTKPVITMPEPGTVPVTRKTLATVSPIDMESQIRERAYQLYQARGCTPGQENEDWIQAEHEIRTRQNQQQSA